MEFLENATLEERLRLKKLIEQLREALVVGGVKNPERWVLPISTPEGEASLLIMPVWKEGEGIVVKAVTYFPQNGEHGLPTIHAGAMAFDGSTGALQAMCDADILTARRTAAGSALAAEYLARRDAKQLLVIGTGQLSVSVAHAHSLMRDYDRVEIWGRDYDKAQGICDALWASGLKAVAVRDLEMAVRKADVVSSVTSATKPLIKGEWLKTGAHVDLVGSFRSDMRESDDVVMKRGRIFVDTKAGALRAGDLAQPLEHGIIQESDVVADLQALVRGENQGREGDEITVFKSAGFAMEDYVAMQALLGDQ